MRKENLRTTCCGHIDDMGVTIPVTFDVEPEAISTTDEPVGGHTVGLPVAVNRL
jgi:hypothetical protein